MITTARRELEAFLWIALQRSVNYTVKINELDVYEDIFSAKFSHGLIGEDMECEIDLDNNSETYTGLLSAGQVVEFLMDFGDGTTTQWKGIIDNIQNKIDSSGFVYKIKGSHYSASLLDITINEEFSSSTISSILTSIITSYLPSFTANNVETNNTIVDKIIWKNKAFWDCVLDLMKLGNADCYIDENKDFHFFTENSHINDNDCVIYEDSLIELTELGQDTVQAKNKIVVYGDAGGLPVISTSNDTSSQSSLGVKESIIEDSSIIDEIQADEVGNAEKELLSNPAMQGSAICYFMPSVKSGDMVYVVSPPHDIQDRFKIIKYTYSVPITQQELFFTKQKGIAQLFKKRIEKDTTQEKITNPFKMIHSYNFTFDNTTKINSAGTSTNVTVSNGKLIMTSGQTGTMTSNTLTTPVTVTQVHLLVIGTALSGTTYQVSADGINYQDITPDTLTNITNTGNQLTVKVVLNSTSTEIDSLAVLYK